ncbi:MAG: N-acyl-L-amino acid amidohydrolase [Bacteroidetes bacterium GWE2_29_8]|nr:MAG: N-acyl-L-amino acid amidohydrolase [Bacteroidetes bacterium GWE2_29_8]OFY24486.1 MAG: N-acyl-L-amino acid amidohydrolase [Bacteroidetes bacterium GWF2_29_10]
MSNQIIQKIKDLTQLYNNEIIDIRRHIHKYPELSFKEYQTSKYIKDKLNLFGITDVKNVTETGVVAIVKGNKKDNTNQRKIALRADMDALPITEFNKTEYISQNNGVMHACGHDVHTAVLLGTAKIINELKNEFSGEVMFIFQPAEETFPGGAISMIKEGLFNEFNPDYIFGLHVQPLMEVGNIGMKIGDYMASTDEIYLTINGKGGHAATPDLLIDPVIISANILIGLQQIASRNCPANIPMVLSFGRVICEGRTNIIPDSVQLHGTLRTMNEQWRKSVHQKIENIATNIAKSFGATCDIEIAHGYPVLTNNQEATTLLKNAAVEIIGYENILNLDYRMTAEDFAYFSQKYKSCFFRLGISNGTKHNSNLHTTTFDIDEASISTGIKVMTWNAIKYIK